MGMQDVLHTATEQVSGVKLAGIIGTDGLGVEMVLGDVEAGFDSTLAEIELGGLAASAAAATARMQAGALRDLIVETDTITYLASQIIPGYYAVLGIAANSNLGRARYALRQMVEQLQSTM